VTTLSVSKAIFTFLFLLLGAVGFTTAGASTVRAGDGPSFQFCYDYNCPKPHFSVLHQRSRKAAHVARDQPARPHTRLDQTDPQGRRRELLRHHRNRPASKRRHGPRQGLGSEIPVCGPEQVASRGVATWPDGVGELHQHGGLDFAALW